ncbi:MarR family transcriptional regulator [Thermomicrobium sp. 4228-Ro]|uniref:MarR family transcriptional regulator n=1 Tax=Thermomicrobium sp. 4228-Ro TaxID=2993937 RepID=UPI0022497F4B|nr:MarR family transcriptional regulator [Thermomicrobium sp. 4228-Ro]MCX2727560.1 MarR family transcriptional regulator [Thermomicrobium sp. 4228-Ro]
MHDRDQLIEMIIEGMRDIVAYLHRRSPPPFDALDLTMAQLKVLFAVSCGGSLTISEIAERLGISLPTASHLVDRVVQLGLAARREDERDRRRTLVEITERGDALLRQVRQGNEQPWRELLAELAADDLAALLRGVQALTTVVRQARTGSQV